MDIDACEEQYKKAGQEEMNEVLHDLREIGAYSDLTVVCGPHHFEVHRNVLCPRSRFFAAACKTDTTKEPHTTITLQARASDGANPGIASEGDDPEIVKLMIDFMYRFEYSLPPPPPAPRVARKSAPSTPGEYYWAIKRNAGMGCEDAMLHIKMYALGSKYEIVSLKAAAVEKLWDTTAYCWRNDGFAGVIRLVFSIPVKDHDAEALHAVMLHTVQENRGALMKRKAVKAMIKSIDRLSSAVQAETLPTVDDGPKAGRERCFECHQRLQYYDEEGCPRCGVDWESPH